MASLLEMKCNVVRPKAGEEQKIVTLTATIRKGEELDTKEIPITVLPWTNQEAVALDLNELKYSTMLGLNPNETQVTKNLTLPIKGKLGSTITWQSSNPAIITTTGEVTRPAYSKGNAVVVLKAVIEADNVLETKEFTINVIRLDQTIEEELEAYRDSMTLDKILGANTSGEEVKTKLSFPPLGPDGSGIVNTWKTNDLLIIDAGGNVFRPSSSSTSQFVTITLTMTKNLKTTTRDYSVKVLAETV